MQMQTDRHLVASLANLSTETILSIDDVSLERRLLALPGVQEVRRASPDHSMDTQVTLLSDTDNGRTFDVATGTDVKQVDPRYLIITERYAIHAGLVIDWNMPNPLDAHDGEGRLFFADPNRGSRLQYWVHRGYTEEGDKDLSLDAVVEQSVADVMARVNAHPDVERDLVALLKDYGQKDPLNQAVWRAIADGPSSTDVVYAFTGMAATWSVDANDRERLEPLITWIAEAREPAWDKAYAAGSLYKNQAVEVDTAWGAAVWAPDPAAELNLLGQYMNEVLAEHVRHVPTATIDLRACPDPSLFAAFGMLGGPSRTRSVLAHYEVSVDQVAWHGKFSSLEDAIAGLVTLGASQGIAVDGHALKQRMYDIRERYANGAVINFDAWANGENYGLVMEVFDRHTGAWLDNLSAPTWGVLGHANALAELDAMLIQEVGGLISPPQ